MIKELRKRPRVQGKITDCGERFEGRGSIEGFDYNEQ